MQSQLASVRTRLANARHIVAFTGAGMSAESGLATFRGPSGLWEGARPEDLATPNAFRRNPQRVWRWYNWRRAELAKARPNKGHEALAAAAQHVRLTIITQNVDRLHQAAGSRDVIELHGNLHEVRCTACGATFDKSEETLDEEPTCDDCDGLLRPAVVWFGEELPRDALAHAWQQVVACDVLLVIGTSGVVQPAAGLVHDAMRAGSHVVEINTEPTNYSGVVDVSLHGPCGMILPQILPS
jgi:NAD-dependent deacetylase